MFLVSNELNYSTHASVTRFVTLELGKSYEIENSLSTKKCYWGECKFLLKYKQFFNEKSKDVNIVL